MQDRGLSLLEALVAVALLALGVVVLTPAVVGMLSTARTGAGAREMALRLQALRWRSVAGNAGHALCFRHDRQGWHWYVVRDGNGNGVRSAELRVGTDVTLSGPHRLEQRVSHVSPGFLPGVQIPRIPPRRGGIDNLEDPIKFGPSDLISCSPLGTCTSGTLYVTDRRIGQFAVVLFGPTARIRVWRYDVEEERWRR